MLNSEIAVFEYLVRKESGISEVTESPLQLMYISPNPVRTGQPCKIKFEIPNEVLKDFYIAIYSTLGETVYDNHQLQPIVEVQGLRQGLYIIRLWDVNNRNHQTRKVVVID